MAQEIKAMMGALNNGSKDRDKSNGSDNIGSVVEGVRMEDEDDQEEEEQLYVNIGSIMNKGKTTMI